MTPMRRAIWFLVGASVLGGPAFADPSQATPDPRVRQSFHMEVPVSPAPVPIAGATQLVYELHLTNFARDTLTLTSVRVIDDSSGTVIGESDGASLEALLGRPGLATGATGRRAVAPGMRAIVYFNVPVTAAMVPRTFHHRVEFDVMTGDEPTHATVEGGAAHIDERPLPELGPPLRGGPWVAVHDPSWERGHRRVFYAIDGLARIPGRFAIDWMRANGRSDSTPVGATAGAAPDGRGAEVLAVANALVAAVRDDMAEPKNCADRAPSGALEDDAGNYIVLDIGGGRYAFYEHLQPGALVKPGDRVRRGQVIGTLGCTGSASMPHLHFHVGDSPLPLGAEGLPYALANFDVLGMYDTIEQFGRGEMWRARSPRGGAWARTSFPAPNLVVRFPDE